MSISRNTINAFMKLFKANEHSLEDLLSFDNTRLEVLFPSRTTIDNKRYDELMRYFEEVNKASNHPGFTFLYHYNEYVDKVSNPYSYTPII